MPQDPTLIEGLEANVRRSSPWSADTLDSRGGHDPNFLGAGAVLPLPPPGEGRRWLRYTHFSVLMDVRHRQAAMTVVDIDGARLREIKRRKGDTWFPDPRLEAEQQPEKAFFERPDPRIDAKRNPLAYGHLVRRLDPAWGDEAEQAEAESFHLTNASPQAERLNSGAWNLLEDIVLNDLRERLRIRAVVLAGPVFREADFRLHDVFPVPAQYWKIVAWRSGRRLAAAGWRQHQPSEVLPEGLESVGLPFDGKAGRAWLMPIREIAELTGMSLEPLVEADTFALRRLAHAAALGLESADAAPAALPLPAEAEELVLVGLHSPDDAAEALAAEAPLRGDCDVEEQAGGEPELEALTGTPEEIAGHVSPRAFDLIVRHETGGPAYYDKVIRKRPVWPGHRSGITIGFGYDLGHVTAAEFERDWGAALPQAERAALARCVGLHGGNAAEERLRQLLAAVRHVVVEWPVAEAVYRAATLPRFAARTNQVLPNCEMLHPDSFGALVSLTFNRGTSYRAEGDRYAEMRAVRDAMEARRFAEISRLIRAMRRIWTGTTIEAEMHRRRENEAALFEAGLAAMPAPLAAPALMVGASATGGLESADGGGRSPAAAGPIPLGVDTWEGTGDEEAWQPFTEEDAAAVAGAGEPDGAAELGLESIGATRLAWAPDADSPDYAHLTDHPAPAAMDFTLAGADLALLAAVNSFPVKDAPPDTPVLFGLRGAAVLRDHAGDSEPVLRDQRPDHLTPRCAIGAWDRASGGVSVFTGSTVPDRRAVVAWQTRRTAGNLLATGLYRYVVGVHNGRPGCFLLRDVQGNKRVVVVRRSSDDLAYDLADLADRCAPGDNIHPSFFSAPVDFSSFGCQTVVGSADNSGNHRGSWAEFRRAAGLTDGSGRAGRPYLYMLLTGREARLASLLRRQGLAGDPGALAQLRRLRFGSRGAAVRRLQERLGLPRPDGDLGPATAEALHGLQRRMPPVGGRSDGIFSPRLDAALGWGVLSAPLGV
jgi:DNA/RNA endonuclease G (NUC1)/GH24 family phage-related lysozyme (muramidase)